MYITLLNTEFVPIAILDYYESLIWTDRYREAGDFEMYFTMNTDTYTLMQENYYLLNTESEHVMIIEKKEVISDIESGDKLLIKGRSLESILDRRIVWGQMDTTGNLQNGVKKLITKAIINPDQSLLARKIENFDFIDSADEIITGLTLTAQYTGEPLYDILVDLGQDIGLGFKITLVDNRFKFLLYMGTDRSINQTERMQIIFSPSFDNIINSDYLEDIEPYKNVAYVVGEENGSGKNKTITVGTESGLNRRELYVDAKDTSSSKDEGGTMTTQEYNDTLTQRGKEKLAENKIIRTFDGEVDTNGMFVLNRDFFLGDIVQFIDNYGNNRSVRVEEIIYSDDTNEIKCYPSFTVIDDVEGE